MADNQLVADRREGTGKGVARKLRAAGRVPAVLYGAGVDATALSVDAKDLYHLLHTGAGTNVLVDLQVDGETHLALPRDVQRDHIRGRYVHVDFLAVRADAKIVLAVPVHVVGESPGVKLGGVLEHHLWEIQVECLPTDVPDAIEADVSVLEEIGTSLKVANLVAPEGVTILTSPDESVVAVQQPQARVEEVVEVAEGEEAVEAAEGEAPAAEAPSEESGEGE
jgi:large subunit ribosomal protein L25